MDIKRLIFNILVIVLMILGILNEFVLDIPPVIIIVLASICILVQVYEIIRIIINKNRK